MTKIFEQCWISKKKASHDFWLVFSKTTLYRYHLGAQNMEKSEVSWLSSHCRHLSPGQTVNVWRPNTNHQTLFGDQKFTVWTLGLVLFNRVWSCLIKFDQKLKTFHLFSCLMGDVLFVWSAACQTSNKRTTLVQRLLSIVWSVFDQPCFNRLATHFNVSMFGHQTMFDGVWSPNISRLSRA